ncbi:hypothetical protein RhiirC2_798557 [Rhizophagus irregularis]|uniref:SAM domain-containing protein n=1 Tax=Rhizophagus irregularis TaxID=588596 RepID=A0A2N1M691_9GLOM|nr:hypothetical protein RhiirC2_798557 [Rhizophagus irregularis]
MKKKINKRTQPSNIIYQIDDDEEIDNKKKKKSNCDDKKKKTKTPSNQIPKEKSLNEADAQIAKTVMELHSRWYCNEHDRSCYVDLTRHITLTTNHLSTWAKSIDHNLASLEEPPTLPLFDAAYSVKRTNNNLQHSNIQTSNSFYPSTTTSSSFIAMPFPVYYLEKEFGENTFEGVKDKFIQETIDVLDIFDLKETDWQDLEIKIGLKTKIIREAEKYRR